MTAAKLDLIVSQIMNLINQHKIDKSIIEIENALLSYPNSHELLSLLGTSLRLQQKFAESITVLEKAKKIAPFSIDILMNIGITYVLWQKPIEALSSFDSALDTKNIKLSAMQEYIPLLRKVTDTLRKQGHTYKAIELLSKIVNITPNSVADILALASAYYNWVGNSKQAKKYYNIAYSIAPKDPQVLQQFSTFLQESRYGIEHENLDNGHKLALELLEVVGPRDDIAGTVQCSAINLMDYESYNKFPPNNGKPSWLSLMLMGQVKTLQDRINLVEAHLMLGDKMDEMARPHPIKHRVTQRFNNKIRIGFLSSDLHNSPVGYFVWPIAENFDRSKFEIYCYSFFPYGVDDIQRQFIRKVDVFRSYRAQSDAEAAQSIADDNLDILFELGGLSSFSKLVLCAYKPAPIQVSWLGYPHSIGLKSIDYIVADHYIAPKNPQLLIEKPMLMPETWVSLDKIGFLPTKITATIPEDRNGYITFGTMNAPYKINLESFRIWAEIMNRVENSRFLYCRPETSSHHLRSNFCKHMARHGISADRIQFISTRTQHLDHYNSIDIALDTFPHNGGTTTCETLWMGVPLVTLVGESFFERISYSNLNNSGLGDLCAFTLEEYRDITLKLVEHKERRRYLRQHLRTQISQHPLGQPKRFVHGFENSVLEVLGKK